jgi:DNA-binding HxlR family transcriptional regulator
VKRADNRSDCPVNYAVETLGDSWSLLIVRDMVTVGKRTFGEFLESDERIGTSVLAQRLVALEAAGVLTKRADEADRRRTVYLLTPAGEALIPVIYDLNVWGTATNASTDSHPAWYEAMRLPRDTVVGAWQRAVAAGSSFYFGPHSVVSTLGLIAA